MKKIKVGFLIIILLFNVLIYQTDVHAYENSLNLYSLSAVLIDGDTGRVLYGKEENTKRAMASTTKIMTLIITLEYGNPDDIVTVSSYASKMPDVQLGINEGEQYLLKDLIYSMMLESHNDSAVAIAEHIGGSVEGFANMMNNKAREIGLCDTYFITSNGLDAKDERGFHHTTAKELALIMKYCINDSPVKDEFINICQTRSYSFSDYTNKRSFTVNNKNAFLDMTEGVIAGKTGFTGEAGYCYVCAVKRDERTFIIALLGCGWPNNKTYKWKDTKTLLDYGLNNFKRRSVFDKDYPLPDVKIKNGIDAADVKLYADDELSMMLRDDEVVSYETDLPDIVNAPVHRGEIAGSVTVIINNEPYKSFNIYYSDDINKTDYRYFFIKTLHGFFIL